MCRHPISTIYATTQVLVSHLLQQGLFISVFNTICGLFFPGIRSDLDSIEPQRLIHGGRARWHDSSRRRVLVPCALTNLDAGRFAQDEYQKSQPLHLCVLPRHEYISSGSKNRKFAGRRNRPTSATSAGRTDRKLRPSLISPLLPGILDKRRNTAPPERARGGWGISEEVNLAHRETGLVNLQRSLMNHRL